MKQNHNYPLNQYNNTDNLNALKLSTQINPDDKLYEFSNAEDGQKIGATMVMEEKSYFKTKTDISFNKKRRSIGMITRKKQSERTDDQNKQLKDELNNVRKKLAIKELELGKKLLEIQKLNNEIEYLKSGNINNDINKFTKELGPILEEYNDDIE